ncbi:hypothetical protein BKA80DRAFT_74403 [Phyllosticta citrichinensis]
MMPAGSSISISPRSLVGCRPIVRRAHKAASSSGAPHGSSGVGGEGKMLLEIFAVLYMLPVLKQPRKIRRYVTRLARQPFRRAALAALVLPCNATPSSAAEHANCLLSGRAEVGEVCAFVFTPVICMAAIRVWSNLRRSWWGTRLRDVPLVFETRSIVQDNRSGQVRSWRRRVRVSHAAKQTKQCIIPIIEKKRDGTCRTAV